MAIYEGTFTSKKGDEFVAYLVKLGLDKAMCEKMRGTNWSMSIRVLDNGDFVVHSKCEEMPSFNDVDTFREGVEKDVDSPIWGGKATINFVKTGPASFVNTIKSKQYGTTVTEELYTDEGLHITSTAKDKGASIKEFWPREVNINGCFRQTKDENMIGYAVAQGLDAKFAESFKGFKVIYEWNGNTVTFKEKLGGEWVVNKATLDKEGEYKIPNFPNFDKKVLLTKTGNGKYKMLTTAISNGNKEEWDMEFTTQGIYYLGKDKTTGQTCKIWCTPCPNLEGKFRMVANTGFEELGLALGLSADLVTKMQNEYDAELTMKELSGDVMAYKYVSKYMPMEATYKFGEEFTYTAPGFPEPFKAVMTLNGNVVTDVSKTSKQTTVTYTTFTENYCIQDSHILGTDVRCKVIMERI